MTLRVPAGFGPALLGCFIASSFMVAAPLLSLLAPTLNPHDFTRQLQLAVVLLCALCVWRLLLTTSASGVSKPWAAWATTALGLSVISTALAASPTQALRELCLLAGLVCIATCFAAAAFDASARFVLPILAVGASCYATLLVLIASFEASTHPRNSLVVAELFVGFDNFRFYNHVQTISLLLTAVVASDSRRRHSLRAASWVGLVCSFALLWLSAGRSTTVAVSFAALGLVALAGRSGRSVARTLVISACLGAAIGFSLSQGLDSSTSATPAEVAAQSTALTNDHSRFFLCGLAWEQIKSSPWLGIGPLHFASQVNVKAAHPHNIYLQIAAEWGLPMLLLAVLAAAWGLWKMGRTIQNCADGDQRRLGAALWAACLALAVDGLFSGNFVMPLSQTWIAAAIGLAFAWHRQFAAGTQPPESSFRSGTVPTGHWRWLTVLLVMPPVWLMYEVEPEMSKLQTHLAQVQRELAPNPRTNPRFWSHGWFRP